MRNNKLVLMEIDGDLVKMLVVRRIGKANFIVEKALKTNLKDMNFKSIIDETKKGRIILSFPRELIVLRRLEVKSLNYDETLAEVKSEIEEGLPFEKGVIWDAVVVKRVKEVEKMTKLEKVNEVLFVAAREETINQYIKWIVENNLVVDNIIPSTIGLVGAYHLSPSYSKRSTLIVYIGTKRADLVVYKDDAILMSRGIEFRNDREKEIIDCIQETIISIKENNITIDRILLSSNSIEFDIMVNKIKEITHIETEEFKIPIVNANVDLRDFVLCIGLANVVVGVSRISLDLNKSKDSKLKKTPLDKLILKFSIGISAILLLVSLILFVLGKIELSNLNKLKAEATNLGVVSGKHWNELVFQVFRAIPKEVVLTEVSGNERGELIIRGTTPSREGITTLLNFLNKLNRFTPELGFANEVSSGDKQLIQFQIKITRKVAIR